MPVIQRIATVPAGGTLENIFSGSAFEFLRQPSLVSIAIVADVPGGFATIQSGADIVAEEFPVFDKATPPVVPDDFYYSDFGAPGDRLRLSLRNPTGGNVVFTAVAQVTPT